MTRADQHHGEVLDLAGLNQRQRFEQLVERADSSGQPDEGVRVLYSSIFRTKKCLAGDPAIEVRLRFLLVRQLDVAADRPAAGPRGRRDWPLPSARTAAGHHRESLGGQPAANLTRQGVGTG